MLPEAPVTSSQQYKRDTNFVASWLATTAKSCGYPSDLLSEARDKEFAVTPTPPAASGPDESEEPASATTDSREQSDKPKTAGKNKKKRKAAPPTEDAASVAPKKYIVAIKEFIPLAQFVSNSKQKIASVPDSFVSALNRVIGLRSSFGAQLSQYGVKPSKAADMRHNYFLGVLDQVRQVLRPRMTADGARASNETPDSLSNRFSALNLFEPSQKFLDAPDAKPAKLDKDVVYEAETAVFGEDAIFFFQLLWRDLFDIRMHIRNIWGRHMRDQLKFDLASAAVASNTALDLARHLIDDALPDFEGSEGGIYSGMKQQTALMLHRIRDDPGNMYFGLSSTTPDDVEIKYQAGMWTYTHAYNILTEVLPPLMPEGSPIGPILPRNEDTEAGPDNHWRSDDYNELKIVIGDLMVVAESIKDWPVEDNLLRGLKETIETRKIPFYFVFASAVQLDLISMFKIGDEHMKNNFLGHVRVTQDMIKTYLMLNDKSDSTQLMKPLDAQVRQVAKECTWIKEDRIYEARLRKLPKESRAEAKATLDKHSLFKRNAIMDGLILFRHRLMLYRAGLSLANTTRSIVATLHLHNVLNREQRYIDKKRWLDMEIAFTLVAQEDCFAANVPGYYPGYIRSVLVSLGFTIDNFVDAHRTRAKYVTQRGQTGSENWNAEDVLYIVEAARKAREDEERKEPGKIQKKQHREAALDKLRPQDLVELVFSNLLDERWRVTYPFFVLHAQTFGIMKVIGKTCEPLLRRILGPAQPAVSELDWPLFVACILQAWGVNELAEAIVHAAARIFNQKFESKLYFNSVAAMMLELGWHPGPELGGELPSEDQATEGPVDIRQQPVNVGRFQESFGMPIDVSRITQSGVYVDTSGLRGNVRPSDNTVEIDDFSDLSSPGDDDSDLDRHYELADYTPSCK
ncbi:hypothetical protein CSOJ01_15197 [Colletotrichum sojae]|uniref:DUF6604 domain-containing protein n=1 Tax=Colletotrichum sojae TaxID=2175907 RepID=A0A8H6MJ16_9PEZI|nr:hypothetical protein CSOJ01_15197 [Colletotrichum sojae]